MLSKLSNYLKNGRVLSVRYEGRTKISEIATWQYDFTLFAIAFCAVFSLYLMAGAPGLVN